MSALEFQLYYLLDALVFCCGRCKVFKPWFYCSSLGQNYLNCTCTAGCRASLSLLLTEESLTSFMAASREAGAVWNRTAIRSKSANGSSKHFMHFTNESIETILDLQRQKKEEKKCLVELRLRKMLPLKPSISIEYLREKPPSVYSALMVAGSQLP